MSPADEAPPRPRPEWMRHVPALLLVSVTLIVAALWFLDPAGIYTRVFQLLGIPPVSQNGAAYLFFDWHSVVSALECQRAGHDVLRDNPCDMIGRPFVYSPLWLEAAALPVTSAWMVPGGLALCAAFLGSLFFLPPARNWLEVGVLSAAMVSSTVLFLLERTNIDIFIFILAVAALRLGAAGKAGRAGAYAVIILAGILKFYPMTAAILAARERLGGFFAVGAAVAVAVALYLAIYGEALLRVLEIIPTGFCVDDAYGALNMPRCTALFAERLGWRWPYTWHVLAAALMAASGWFAVRLVRNGDMARRVAALTPTERDFLLAGGALVLACFLTAYNLYYRAVFLLLAMPGLLALWRHPGEAVARRWAAAAVGAAILFLWGQALHGPLLILGPIWDMVFGIAREIAWWWFAGFMVGVMALIVRGLPAWQEATARLRRRPM